MATMDSASASSASAASSMDTANHQQYFVDSTKGNIKEVYSFQQKLANGGFGIVYLAEHRESKQKFAIKAIQKKKVKDYTTFINEINILKVLVSAVQPSRRHTRLLSSLQRLTLAPAVRRITLTSSSCTRSGNGTTSASSSLSKSFLLASSPKDLFSLTLI